jgi:hypothetical protein
MSLKGIEPVNEVTYDGTVFRIYHANKGDGLPKHSHYYSHLTMCHAGSCIVRKEVRSLVINKNSLPVDLGGQEWHEIEALEDGTVFVNVFAENKY